MDKLPDPLPHEVIWGMPVQLELPFEPPTAPAQPASLSDPVFRPNYYARYVIEPLTFINANKLPYNIGNVIKYVCRYDAKNGVEDLRKARRYIDIQIETIERERRVAAGENPNDVWKEVL